MAEQIYWYKASEDGRKALRALLSSEPRVRERELRPITEDVISFWHAAMAEVDTYLLEGRSLIPFAREDWKESNHAAYERFLEDHLAKTPSI